MIPRDPSGIPTRRQPLAAMRGQVARAVPQLNHDQEARREPETSLVEGETGASLRAAGWRVVAARPPRRGWHTPSRPRTDHGVDHTARLRWQQP